MISIDGLTVEFSGTTLFKDISFTIGDKDRIALMGKNGAGKSTLLKIIAGVRSATRGRVTVGEGGKVGYLPQHLQVEDGRTLVEEASRAFEHLFEIERRIAALNEQLTTRTDYESESYMRLIEEVTAISEKFYAVDLTNYQEDVERILLGLGFERSDFTRQTSEFSGGWRMRIELAKLLLQKPDLLLLDEPTNHLDIESIEWLEDFLMNNAKAVMVISHDKAFVDHITTRTIEIARGRIYDYKVNYSHYLELRRERREQQQAAYDNQQKMIAETREFIERFEDQSGAVARADARKTGTHRGGRGGPVGAEPALSARPAFGFLSGHHLRTGQGVRRPPGVQRRVDHHRARRQGGFRGAQRRGQVDDGQGHHGADRLRGRDPDRP